VSALLEIVLAVLATIQTPIRLHCGSVQEGHRNLSANQYAFQAPLPQRLVAVISGDTTPGTVLMTEGPWTSPRQTMLETAEFH
jgi:hypothetical protein